MRKIRPYGCDENFPGSDYQNDELEFFKAVERYKRKQRLKYVSLREVLEIVKSLGYRKTAATDSSPSPAQNNK